MLCVCVSRSLSVYRRLSEEYFTFDAVWKCEFFVLFSNLQSIYFRSTWMRKTRWKIKRIAKLIYQYGWMWCDDIIVRPILYISSSSSNSGRSSSTTPYHSHISHSLQTNPYIASIKSIESVESIAEKLSKITHIHRHPTAAGAHQTPKNIFIRSVWFFLFFFFVRLSVVFTSNMRHSLYTRT